MVQCSLICWWHLSTGYMRSLQKISMMHDHFELNRHQKEKKRVLLIERGAGNRGV